jgi:diaminohydroxyphosphoribosylaminopyrimidine deaminase/5-amino-6-(5-phosphoribosylamino)uracil reductase
MRHALTLARRGAGRTAPNPSVGCVIVKEGRVVGRGRTADGGRPHAEQIALAEAGSAAKGATAYVTLEPCAQQTETPSCAESLIDAGVTRAVIAVQDPDHRTDGYGIVKLRAADIVVETGLLEDTAVDTLAGFLTRVKKARPYVTLKIAQSLDGKTATAAGESKWITSQEARRFGHLMRAENDAILVGINTVLRDDPELTCRLPGLESASPVRVVLDTELKFPEGCKLARSAREVPVLIYTTANGGAVLKAKGLEVVKVRKDARGRPDIDAVLADLGKRGFNRLLVEGGATVHASFLDRGLADRLEVFTAPMALGAAGQGAVEALAVLGLDEASRFCRGDIRKLGPDLLESFTVRD